MVFPYPPQGPIFLLARPGFQVVSYNGVRDGSVGHLKDPGDEKWWQTGGDLMVMEW